MRLRDSAPIDIRHVAYEVTDEHTKSIMWVRPTGSVRRRSVITSSSGASTCALPTSRIIGVGRSIAVRVVVIVLTAVIVIYADINIPGRVCNIVAACMHRWPHMVVYVTDGHYYF